MNEQFISRRGRQPLEGGGVSLALERARDRPRAGNCPPIVLQTIRATYESFYSRVPRAVYHAFRRASRNEKITITKVSVIPIVPSFAYRFEFLYLRHHWRETYRFSNVQLQLREPANVHPLRNVISRNEIVSMLRVWAHRPGRKREK